ncbi:carbon-nitrogen hydrolase family protein [Bowmanella dokdonensis]|uniref:Carbon-nitrogen hydrolase family protein n=1 Tax=Bowmanella dokdonensis TaxID=751969 RepID=A0A939DQJ4_9ALTE|nr:carbon-nitrogen hydrolase family protein [Bowmanella dokdonensis]MBN7826076.1 carbon-nitrogen hydrolase family protein [Bowmanella dokdonensis]
MVNLVAVQLVSTPKPEENLAQVEQQLKGLENKGPQLVVLPECFACFGGSDKAQLAIAEEEGQGPVQDKLAALAKQHGIYLVAGSLPIKAGDDKFFATSLLFSPAGEQIALYRKIHLFDVEVEDGTGTYLESRYTRPGNQVVVVETDFGRIGMAICYDLRFPGLFQAMGQVEFMVLPAAFTKVTGQAHWWALLQARSIEMQCFVVAADQGGRHANGRETFGHSAILSPWGETLISLQEGPGLIQARVGLTELEKIRQRMPVMQHNQFRSLLIEPS